MRTDDFWALIERARADAAGGVSGPGPDSVGVSGPGPDSAGVGGPSGGPDGGAETAHLVAERMTRLLAAREPAEIVGYDRHLRRVMAASYRVDLWGAAYLINGGASDDGFDYFRGWLITQGRAVFARTVTDPDSLAELAAVRRAAETGEEFECEDVLHVAADAYRRVTGAELPADPDRQSPPEIGEFWDFDDEEEARRRLPRLAALFVEPPQE